MSTTATEARKPVRIAGETYYYTRPEEHTYKFEFPDGRYIGQITYIQGTGREKDYWIPGTTGVHVAFWGEACALLLQEYWRKQATQAAPVERAPEPPKQEEPPASGTWMPKREAAAALGLTIPGVQYRIKRKTLQARPAQRKGNDPASGWLWEVFVPAESVMDIPESSVMPNTNGHKDTHAGQEARILSYVQEHGEVTRQDCVQELHLTQDQATKRLMALYRMGKLQRVNGGSAVRYILAPAPDSHPAPSLEVTPPPATQEEPPAPEPAPAPTAFVQRAGQAAAGLIMRPETPLADGLLKQIEQLHAARVEDARTIGRLTMQVEILEARLAECQKPAPRKWWQP